MSIVIKQHIKRGNFALKVDLELPIKGISAIFGPSGSGKSSLLRAIAGLDQHPEGLVKIGAQEWQNASHFTPIHQRKLAYVFQEDNLFPHLNVEQNIDYACRRAGASLADKDKFIALLDIKHLLQHRSSELSGGQRQKVAIARALVQNPALILMDEPMTGLDMQFRDVFLPQLRELIQALNIPMLYVSHAPDEVAQLADTLVLIEEGKQPYAGELSELLTSPEHSLAYRRDAESVIDAEVGHLDSQYNLLELGFSGGLLNVSAKALPSNNRVRVRIWAQDVSITLSSVENTSILNILPAKVLAILPCNDSQVSVLLVLGESKLLARITRKSAEQLDLSVNMQVFAQIKSVALIN